MLFFFFSAPRWIRWVHLDIVTSSISMLARKSICVSFGSGWAAAFSRVRDVIDWRGFFSLVASLAVLDGSSLFRLEPDPFLSRESWPGIVRMRARSRFRPEENRIEVIRYVLRPVPVFVDPSSGSLEGVSPQPMQPNSSSLSGCIRSRIKSNWGNPGTISQTSSPNRSSRRAPPLRSVKSGVFFVVILLVPL
jgi:hypothetical protein